MAVCVLTFLCKPEAYEPFIRKRYRTAKPWSSVSRTTTWPMDAVYSGYNLSMCSVTGSHHPSCLEAPQLHQAHGMCHEMQKHVKTPAVPLPGSPSSGHGHAAPQHIPAASCRGSAMPKGGPVSYFQCFAPENTDPMEHSCQDDNCFNQ